MKGVSEDLPEGWTLTKLGGVVQPSKERVEPSEVPAAPYLSLEHIEPGSCRILGNGSSSDVTSTKSVFKSGDVLYGKLRPYLNKVCKPDFSGICSTDILVFPSTGHVDSSYLMRFLSTPQAVEYANHHSAGVQLPRVSFSALAEMDFPLPPLPEQKRIVAKVEELLARVNAARERLARLPAILKRFRQSVLAAACSGNLTEEWRRTNLPKRTASDLAAALHNAHQVAGGHKVGNAAPPTENVHDLTAEMFPSGWELLTLRDLVMPDRPITYGILKPGPDTEGGIPYVRVADYPNDRLNLTAIRRTSPRIDQEFRRSRLQRGDLLLSIRGTVGRVIAIPTQLEGANITQDSARLSIQSVVNRDFVLWYLRSDLAQRRMGGAIKGVAVRGINIGDVRALQVPLPPREEQDEIVRRIEAFSFLTERIEKQVGPGTTRAEKLTQAILAKAFRGELVPTEAALACVEGGPNELASALPAILRPAARTPAGKREDTRGGVLSLQGKTDPSGGSPKRGA